MKLKAKVEVNGKEIEMDIEVSEEELAKLQKEEKRDVGYGYGHLNDLHYYVDEYNNVLCNNQVHVMTDLQVACNLYHNKTLAKNDARADKLMRQLRKFAAEHNQKKLDWNDSSDSKYSIKYWHAGTGHLSVEDSYQIQSFGEYFDSKETAQLALNTFRDELMWYFTEYNN